MGRGRKNYPGYIQKRGSSYRVTLCVEGKTHRFTVRGSREEAGAEARRRYDELRERSAAGLPGPAPFSALLNRFEDMRIPQLAPNTQKAYRQSLEAFRRYFIQGREDLKAHEIRPAHVEGFMHWRARTPLGAKGVVSPRTVAKDRAVLHAVFAHAETLEIVQANPVRKTKPPRSDARDPVILDSRQYEKLLQKCEGRPMLQLYVLVLGEAGLRCDSEALWLRWEDIDLEGGFLKVEGARKGRRTKSGKARWVPLTPRLREALQAHMAAFRFQTYHGQRTSWVFHHVCDRRRARAGERIGSLRRGFEAAVERADLPRALNQHDLRHRRVTLWLAEGKPATLVKEALGHADLRTTMGYTHLAREHLRALVEEVDVKKKKA